MARIGFPSRAALTLAALTVLFMTAEPAAAVVYCKTVGVPKGCVARPVPLVARRAVSTPGIDAPGSAFAPAPS